MAAPNIPIEIIINLFPLVFAFREASDNRAIIPPSPLLFARIIKRIYLTETIEIRDQKISDNMPSILEFVSVNMLLFIANISLIA